MALNFLSFPSSSLVNHILNTETTESPDLFVYLSYYTPTGGTYTAGSAWVGSVCFSDTTGVNGGSQNGKGFRASVSLRTYKGDLDCAEVRFKIYNPFNCSSSN